MANLKLETKIEHNIENNNNDVVDQVHKSEPTPFLNKNTLNQASNDLESVKKKLRNLFTHIFLQIFKQVVEAVLHHQLQQYLKSLHQSQVALHIT